MSWVWQKDRQQESVGREKYRVCGVFGVLQTPKEIYLRKDFVNLIIRG